MLGIIAEHAVAGDQAVSPGFGEQAADAAPRYAFQIGSAPILVRFATKTGAIVQRQ
jgi:hypothetical protein